MTFTYDPELADNISLVRFHVGDNYDSGHFLDDGEITYFLGSDADVEGAVIAGLRYIITQLSLPDFKASWLTISNGEARKGYQEILKEKAKEFGVSLGGYGVTVAVNNRTRADYE